MGTREKKQYAFGVTLAVGCALIFGLVPVVIRKLSLDGVHPLTIFNIRTFVALLFTICVAIIGTVKSAATDFTPIWSKGIIALSLSRFGTGILWIVALGMMSATVAANLNKMTVFFTLVFAVALKPSALMEIKWRRLVLAVILFGGGAFLVASERSGDLGLLTTSGLLVMLASCALYGIYNVSQQHLKGTEIEKTCFSQRQATVSLALLITLLPGVVVSQFVPGATLITATYEFSQISILGVLSGSFGILQFEAIKRIGAVVFSMIFSSGMFFTVFIESLLFGHPVVNTLLIGALMTFAGFIVASTEVRNL